MIGLLVKREKGYHLDKVPFIAFVSTERTEHNHKKLSLRNCQEIEYDFDLYELAREAFDNMGYHSTVTQDEEQQFKLGYRIAFRKALELSGNKSFTIDDMKQALEIGSAFHDFDKVKEKAFELFTEKHWRVEVKTEKIPCDHNDGWEEVPVLDKDGCLILTKV